MPPRQKYAVKWTRQAAWDLEEIVRFMAAEQPQVSRKQFERIKLKCRQLAMNPERCRKLPELNDSGLSAYRELIVAPWRVIFKSDRDMVWILAVVDGRRDITSFLLTRFGRG